MNQGYNDLKSLKIAFEEENVCVVNNMVDLHKAKEKIKSVSQGHSVFFRGQEEAKWFCRSSLLRKCLDLKEESSNVEDAFNELRIASRNMWREIFGLNFCKRSLLSPYENCNHLRSDTVDEMVVSIIKKLKPSVEAEYNAQWREVLAQHFGFPTALIDFSKDFNVALHFATRNAIQNANSNDGIDQFCSIIVIIGNEFSLVNWEKVREQSMENLEISLEVCDDDNNLLNNPKVDISPVKRKWDAQDDTSSLDSIKILSYVDQEGHRLISNRRIEKQFGVLLCLGKNGHCSLEEAVRLQERDSKPRLGCILINKNLLPEVRQLLDKQGINDEALGL